MARIAWVGSINPELYIGLCEEEIVVCSGKSAQTYGFEGADAAAFLAIEAHLIENPSFKTDDAAVQKAVDLLQGKESIAARSESLQVSIEHFDAQTECYVFQEWAFALVIDDAHLACEIKSALAFLGAKKRAYPNCVIEVDRVDMLHCSVRLNGKIEHEALLIARLVPWLFDVLRIGYYQSQKYWMALHAGVMSLKEHSLLFVAPSGNGKSTLCAYLMAQGFTLFSDEIALIDESANLLPVILPLSIKEGSWERLDEWYPKLMQSDVYERFDGQSIRR